MAIKMMSSQGIIDNVSIENFYGNKDKYNFSLLLQRGIVWDLEKKSNLILSLLLNREVPNMVVNKKPDGTLNFLDGVNRSNAILGFINNKYSIDYTLENIVLIDKITKEETEYEIRGKKFADFDQKLINHFLTRIIYVKIYDNLDEEDEASTILNLNEGVPMVGMAKARVIGYETIHPFINKMIQKELFDIKIAITKSAKEKFVHEQVIIVIVGLEVGITDEVPFGNPEDLVKYIKNENLLTEGVTEEIERVMDYIDLCVPNKTGCIISKKNFLTASNFVPIYYVAKRAMNDNMEEREFLNLLINFYKNEPQIYRELTSQQWNYKPIIDKKIRVLMKFYDNYMNGKIDKQAE
jgi:hypothetical protein